LTSLRPQLTFQTRNPPVEINALFGRIKIIRPRAALDELDCWSKELDLPFEFIAFSGQHRLFLQFLSIDSLVRGAELTVMMIGGHELRCTAAGSDKRRVWSFTALPTMRIAATTSIA
jgi:hypothetical protein